MSRQKLTNNFYLDEFLRSQFAARHGIDMRVSPDGVIAGNLRRLCISVLQPLRDALGPVTITSGYRPPVLNRRIGGSVTSQHQYGLAADIVVAGHTPLEVARWVRDNTPFDQVIHEFGQWVHVSVPAMNRSARKQTLTAVKVPRRLRRPRTVYVPGLFTLERALERMA